MSKNKNITLKLSEIELWGHHGTEKNEEEKGGPFKLSITATCEATSDPEEDLLENRIDYAALTTRSSEIFSEKRFSNACS